MTSCCDVTNSVCPVTKITIRHCSTLAFVRGAYNHAVAPDITRPLHATGMGGDRNLFVRKWGASQKKIGKHWVKFWLDWF